MENSNKNKPGVMVVVSFALIIVVIISYFIILQFFPDLFQTLPTGESQPVTN